MKGIFNQIARLTYGLLPRKPKVPIYKLYVIVRDDLEPIHRCVQGGHAVAEFMREHYNSTVPWDNGYMIYLSVPSEWELTRYEALLKAKSIKFSTFVEPDWGYPTKTAIAFVDTGECVNKLPLLTMADNT